MEFIAKMIWDWLLYGLIFCLFLECFEVNG